MKAYTDLAQSQILAKILPFQSADMKWFVPADNEGEFIEEVSFIKYPSEYNLFEKVTDWNDTPYVPCWSLSALLDVLPRNLNIGRPSLESNYKRYYWLQYYDEFMKPNNYKTKCFNNPVDVCVDMIIKLKERSLI